MPYCALHQQGVQLIRSEQVGLGDDVIIKIHIQKRGWDTGMGCSHWKNLNIFEN